MSENGEIYTAGKKFYTPAGTDGMDKFHLWKQVSLVLVTQIGNHKVWYKKFQSTRWQIIGNKLVIMTDVWNKSNKIWMIWEPSQ